MNPFVWRDGELLVGETRVSLLAESLGTPFFAYDSEAIRTRVAILRQVLPAEVGVHYAIKANPFPPLLRLMATLVDGADVASGGELSLALEAGFLPNRLSIAGPGKRDAELAAAIDAQALINVESTTELARVASIARQRGAVARIAIRINPAFELKGAGMRMGGGARPFGIDQEQVPAVLAQLAAHEAALRFEGFHVFAGSQSLDGSAIAAVMQQSMSVVLELAPLAPAPVTTINLGGGFGIPYFDHERDLDLQPVGAALREVVATARTALPTAKLHLELGRYLVGEAGVYVVRVIDRKVSRGRTYLVTDGGMHHHLAASGNFGQVIRRNYPVAVAHKFGQSPNYSRGDTAPNELVSVVGPLCTPLDILADNVRLPFAEPGDLIAVFQSGAYAASASPQRFLAHPAAAEQLV